MEEYHAVCLFIFVRFPYCKIKLFEPCQNSQRQSETESDYRNRRRISFQLLLMNVFGILKIERNMPMIIVLFKRNRRLNRCFKLMYPPSKYQIRFAAQVP